jgi:hypothetical protein
MLAERLAGTADAGLLGRLTGHHALSGPELTFLRAWIASAVGDTGAARKLIAECLEELPGSGKFLRFAEEIGAELPERARKIAADRAWHP